MIASLFLTSGFEIGCCIVMDFADAWARLCKTNNQCDNLQSKEYKTFYMLERVALSFIGFEFIVFFLGHALFAFKYWLLSKQLEQIVTERFNDKALTQAKWIFFILVLVSSSSMLFYSIAEITQAKYRGTLEVYTIGVLYSLCMLVTTIVVGDGLFRMKKHNRINVYKLSFARGIFLLISFILFDISGLGLFYYS